MLAKPGSSTGRSKTYQSRRKAPESPEQVLRGLQRLAPNKRCADCNSKLPSCINLTVGTFICISCAGIHREHNHRVKGLGHSSFSPEEAEQMKNTDNERVNQMYLAKFNPGTERLRQPQDNTDLQLLRAWIKRKYHDKAWYQDGAGNGGHQPTMAKIPPKQKQAQQPQGDLLGAFDAPAPAPSNRGGGGGGWDAFGGSTGNQAFQANFPPAPAPEPQQQPGFANFNPQPQQPPQQQQGFANFNQQQQQPPPQQQGFANFSQQQQPSQQQNQQPGLANFNQQPQQPPQQQGFANFNQQQQQPPQQQSQQQGFANFNLQQQQQQRQQPQNQQRGMANLNQQQPPQQQLGFANFNQQPPQQSAPTQQQQGGFANFSQQKPQQNQAQAGFANFDQQPAQNVAHGAGFANFNQPASQQNQGRFSNLGQQQPQPPSPAQQQQPQGGFANFNQQQPIAPSPPLQQGGNTNFNQQNQAQAGFASFDQQPAQQGAPSQQNQQQGFANFNQQPSQQSDTTQQQQEGFPNFNQQSPQQNQAQGGFASFDQRPPQQGAPPQAQGHFENFNQQNQQPGQGAFASFNQQNLQHQAPNLQQQQSQPPTPQQQPPQPQAQQLQQPPSLQPSLSAQSPSAQQGGGMGTFGQPTNAISNMQNLSLSEPLEIPSLDKAVSTEASGVGEKNASIQMEAKRPFDIPSPTKDIVAAPTPALASSAPSEASFSVKSQKVVANYSKGQDVFYRNATTTAKATIVKVHLDDDLVPFYTVAIDGKEKQTDDGHIFSEHPLQSDIVELLKGMAESKLQHVLQYVKQLDQSDDGHSVAATQQPQTPSRPTGMMQPTAASSPMPIQSMNPQAQGPSATGVAPSPMPALAPAPAPFPSGGGNNANGMSGKLTLETPSTGMTANAVGGHPSQASAAGMNPGIMGNNQGATNTMGGQPSLGGLDSGVMGNNQGFSIPDLSPQASAPVAAPATSMMTTQNGVTNANQFQPNQVPGQMQPQQQGAAGQFQQPAFAPQQSSTVQMQQPGVAPQQSTGMNQTPSAGFGQPQQTAQMPLSNQLQPQPQMQQPQQQQGAPQGNPFDFY